MEANRVNSNQNIIKTKNDPDDNNNSNVNNLNIRVNQINCDKKKGPKTYFSKYLNITTWNVLTLHKNNNIHKDRLSNIIKYMKSYHVDIIGLSETRLVGNGRIDLKNGMVLYYSGYDLKMRGVGFILSENIHDRLISIEPVSERIIIGRFKIKKLYLTIIQVYAPTNVDNVKNNKLIQKRNEFYEMLQTEVDRVNPNDLLIVMGDMNAKIGNDNVGFETIMGNDAMENLCENGRIFKDFCLLNDLVIGGSLFDYDDDDKVTWYSNDGKTRNQIDHITISKKWKRILFDVKAIKEAKIGSDHRMVRAKLDVRHIPHNLPKRKVIVYYTLDHPVHCEDVDEIWKKLKNKRIVLQKRINKKEKIIRRIEKRKKISVYFEVVLNENDEISGEIRKSEKLEINRMDRKNEKCNVRSSKNDKFDVKEITEEDISECVQAKYFKNEKFLYDFFNLIVRTGTVPKDWYRNTNEISTMFLKIIKKKLKQFLIENLTITSTSIDNIIVLRSIIKKCKNQYERLYMNFITMSDTKKFINRSSWTYVKDFIVSNRLINIIDYDRNVLRSELFSLMFYKLTYNLLNGTGIPWCGKEIQYVQYDRNVCLLSNTYEGMREKTEKILVEFKKFEIVPEMKILKLHPDNRDDFDGNKITYVDTIIFPDGIVTKRDNKSGHDCKPSVINFVVKKSNVIKKLNRNDTNSVGLFRRIFRFMLMDTVSLTQNDFDINSIKKFHNECVNKIINKTGNDGFRSVNDEEVRKMVLIERWKWILYVLQTSDNYVAKQVFKWNPNGSTRCAEKLYNAWGTEVNKELKKSNRNWKDLKNIRNDEIPIVLNDIIEHLTLN